MGLYEIFSSLICVCVGWVGVSSVSFSFVVMSMWFDFMGGGF